MPRVFTPNAGNKTVTPFKPEHAQFMEVPEAHTDYEKNRIHKTKAHGNQRFKFSKKRQNVNYYLDPFEKNTEYHIIANCDMSPRHVFDYLIDTCGPLHFRLAPWVIGQEDLRLLIDQRNKGRLLSIRLILHRSYARIKQGKKLGGMALLVGNFRDEVRFTKSHTKVYTLFNDDWNITIESSGNINEHDHRENWLIKEDRALCDFHTSWIEAAFN